MQTVGGGVKAPSPCTMGGGGRTVKKRVTSILHAYVASTIDNKLTQNIFVNCSTWCAS